MVGRATTRARVRVGACAMVRSSLLLPPEGHGPFCASGERLDAPWHDKQRVLELGGALAVPSGGLRGEIPWGEGGRRGERPGVRIGGRDLGLTRQKPVALAGAWRCMMLAACERRPPPPENKGRSLTAEPRQ
jgi:hypothetical protein